MYNLIYYNMSFVTHVLNIYTVNIKEIDVVPFCFCSVKFAEASICVSCRRSSSWCHRAARNSWYINGHEYSIPD